MPPKIYLSPPHLDASAFRYVEEALHSNWIAPVGPFVDRFQAALIEHSGLPGCCLTNSGTAALHIALRLLGVGPGDEVLCSDFTFVATAGPITYLGAQPVFVDAEPTSWNLCPDALEEAIAARSRARELGRAGPLKALVLAHCYGTPGQIPRILDICHRHGIPVIEDAAEALGSTLDGRPLGTWGDIGIYSFNGNKIITASSGGALVCRDEALARKARWLASQCKEPTPHFEHPEVGYNYAMSNLLAALGLSQLETLIRRVDERRATFAIYCAHLPKHLGGCALNFQGEESTARSNRWLTTFAAHSDQHPGLAERLRLHLQSLEIESRPLWKPLHQQGAFTGAPFYGTGIGDSLFANGLCLPSGPGAAEAVLALPPLLL